MIIKGVFGNYFPDIRLENKFVIVYEGWCKGLQKYLKADMAGKLTEAATMTTFQRLKTNQTWCENR